MDLSNDFIRQELDEIAHHNDVAMALQSEALTRMVETDELDADQRDELITGGLGRRRFLRFGGVAVATSAVFAACGTSSRTRTASTSTTSTSSTTVAGSASTDITALRTASSLEVLAVQTYQKAIGTGLLTTPTVAAAAKDFMGQHQQHAAAFESATTKAGGQAFTQPNSVVSAQVITPALAKVKTENDLVALAYTLESAASQTYQSAIGIMSKPAYNSALASVLGVESRHQALLGLVLNNTTQYPPYPVNGFQTENDAVKIGTGVSS
ncbi:MAG: ferritin-like domain-containing protein [Actinomycetota bacterium]|nr:ferritin-like domain-containing protein [Actinomycetota bacterium]